MSDIVIDDMQHGLPIVLTHVLDRGTFISPRGQETCELIDVGITLTNPERCLATGIGRNMNTGLAAVEALQLIGGVSHPELMGRIAPNTLQFRDGGAFNGAYGPRIGMQLPLVVKRLKEDPSSRQAVVSVWDPLHDLVRETSKDFPCTLSFQFFVRGEKLEMITTMRSNDVWWGFTYDVVQFTQLQWTVANALGIEAGPYHHRAGSLHVYSRDLDAIEKLGVSMQTDWVEPAPELKGIGIRGVPIQVSMGLARRLLNDDSGFATTPTETWMKEALKP